MGPDQSQYLAQLNNEQQTITNHLVDYWTRYSHAGTWQFWVVLLMLIVPLVVLYLCLDRSKAFRIAFFGLNVHLCFGYVDVVATAYARWSYPFRVIPFSPITFSLDGSLVPVVFMLVYQWAFNRNKNTYLYLILTSAVFAFIIKPILSALGLFHMYRWNYIYLFLVYVVVSLVSKWITDLFSWLQKSETRAA